MSTLISGSCGFLGMQLARTLVAADEADVVSMVRDRTKTPPGHFVTHGDVTDQDFCRRVVADYEVDTIYHLAAQSIVSVCAEDPLAALNIAVMGTARLLHAVRDVGRPCRIVCITSDKVYGSAPSPYTEATPLDARHAYEVSKACQDLVARMFRHNYGINLTVVRAVNIYGPGDPNESRIVPKTCRRVLRGDTPELHAGAGDMQRQYIYVDDMVDALRFIAAKGTDDAYCVGSCDAPMSVLDVMRTICRSAGAEWREPEVKARDGRFHEIQSQAVDGSRLAALGWAPTTRFDEGIRRTLDWYRSC